MAIIVCGNPYSIQGASVQGLVSVDYMTGKAKTNSGMLLQQSIPDFSGMKLEQPASSVLSLTLPQDSVKIENSSAIQQNAEKETLQTIQPLKLYTANTAGVSVTEPKYTFHGVAFSHEQIQTATEFLEGLANIMRENGASSGTLDYDDYAVMGLGESQIRTFGKGQGFSEEQINAILTDHRNTLTELVEKNLSQFPLDRQKTHLPHSQYFFLYQSEEEKLITSPDMASNWDLIRSVYDTMAKTDSDSESSVKNAISQFKQQTLPARKAGSVRPDWAEWRVGVYESNIYTFQTSANALQKEMQTKYPHLDTKA